MFNQIVNDAKNDKIPENPDSMEIKSFLKKSEEFDMDKKVISSHS